MEPIKSKLKPVESKLRPDLADLHTFHPVRDLDSHFIINALEKAREKRDLSFMSKLQK